MGDGDIMDKCDRLQAENAKLRADLSAVTSPDFGHWSTMALALKAAQTDLKAALLQNGELWDHLMNAWGVIANAGPEGCLGNWKKMDPQWVDVAEKWRDKWHDMRKAMRVPLEDVIKELHGNAQCDQPQCSCHFPPGTDLTATEKPKQEATHCPQCGGILGSPDYGCTCAIKRIDPAPKKDCPLHDRVGEEPTRCLCCGTRFACACKCRCHD